MNVAVSYYTKTGKNAGKCRTCGKPTPWNEQSMKYDQYCTNPECKKAYAKIAKQRMIDTYGKVHLLNDSDEVNNRPLVRIIFGVFYVLKISVFQIPFPTFAVKCIQKGFLLFKKALILEFGMMSNL